METITLAPNQRPLYAVQPARSHSRLSVRRVLYAKFLRWLDGATANQLRKAVLRTSGVAGIAVLCFGGPFALGILFDVAQNISPRFGSFMVLTALFFYWKRLDRFIRRPRTGNQHTFHGVAIDDLASYLTQHGFKRDHAMRTLGLSKGKYETIAKLLDRNQITVRDDNNGRTMNTISREELVRQLRDDFPLVFDPVGKVWAERRGEYDRFLLSREREEREQKETEARAKRRAELFEKRAENAREELQAMEAIGFATRCVVA